MGYLKDILLSVVSISKVQRNAHSCIIKTNIFYKGKLIFTQ